MAKFITAKEAAGLIEDGMTLGVGGFGAYAAPDELLAALASRYEEEGNPRGLTAVCGISPGSNHPDGRGLARLKAPGLLDTVIAGHFANPPEIAELIGANQIAAYALPLGVMLHLWRAIAGHKPALLTHVGLGTFADPRVEGCKANDKTRAQNRDIVEVVQVSGKDCLAYKTFPINACFIRATWADEDGNLSMEDEGVGDYAFELASATHNSGGIVIAQVRGIVSRDFLPPKTVRIHHPMVDYVVVNTDPALHMQSYAAQLRPELSGQLRCPTGSIPPMPLDNRKIIARRGAMELKPNCLINLGIGIPSGVGEVANEEGIGGQVTLSLESGPQGGVPVSGDGFAAAVNPQAIYTVADMLGGDRLPWQCERLQVWYPLHRPGRVCEYLSEHKEGLLLRHLYRRRPEGGGSGRQAGHPSGGPQQEIPRERAADYILWQLRRGERAGGHLPHRAGCPQAHPRRPDAHRDRPRRGSGEGCPGPDGVQAPHLPQPQGDGFPHLPGG